MISNEDCNSIVANGFLVVRSFLSTEEAEAVHQDFLSQDISANQNYALKTPTNTALDIVRPKIECIANALSEQAGIKTNFDGYHQSYYFASQLLNFSRWHQDAESYFAVQNHLDYLNFYVPVFKPVKEKTNVQVVPWERIEERSPDIVDKLRGQGGTIYVPRGAKTMVLVDEGLLATLPYDIHELGHTPELGPGDLLLMRGDTIHRTQDVDTVRVALSLRLANPETPVCLKKLSSGGSMKTNKMAYNWGEFGPIFESLRLAENRTLPWKTVRQRIEDAYAPTQRSSSAKARMEIIKCKFQTGTVCQSLYYAFRRYLAMRKISRASVEKDST